MASGTYQSSTIQQNAAGLDVSNTTPQTANPVFLGVSPNELYSSNSFSNFVFGQNIDLNNFISFIIQPGTSDEQRIVSSTTVVTMFSSTDNFSLRIGSEYVNPLSGTGGGGPIASVGATLADFGKAVNSTMQPITGISAFNKLAYLPTWSKTQPLSLSLNGILFATSDPYRQVQGAIEMLLAYSAPSTNGSSLDVKSPGPSANLQALAAIYDAIANDPNSSLVDSTTALAKTASKLDLSSFFTGSDQIYVQLGNTAMLGPVIINSVSMTNPNNSIYTKGPVVMDPLAQTVTPGKGQYVIQSQDQHAEYGTTFIPYSEIIVEITCYFPPIRSSARDFDSVQFFPHPEQTTKPPVSTASLAAPVNPSSLVG